MKKLLMALALLPLMAAAEYQCEFANGCGWVYEEVSGEAQICGFTNQPPEVLAFPAVLGGIPVRNIGGPSSNLSGRMWEWIPDLGYEQGGFLRQTGSQMV